MSKTRGGERPAVGDRAVYGEQTRLALGSFKISGRRFPRAFVRTPGLIKGCATADVPGLRFRLTDRGDER